MSKKKRRFKAGTREPYRPGSLDELAPPNREVGQAPGNLADVRSADGQTTFVIEADCRNGFARFNRTRIDPFLFEELLDMDSAVRKLGIKADERQAWTEPMRQRMMQHVQRVFEEAYLPIVLDELEAMLPQVAEYALLRAAGQLELQRLHESIQKHRPTRK